MDRLLVAELCCEVPCRPTAFGEAPDGDLAHGVRACLQSRLVAPPYRCVEKASARTFGKTPQLASRNGPSDGTHAVATRYWYTASGTSTEGSVDSGAQRQRWIVTAERNAIK